MHNHVAKNVVYETITEKPCGNFFVRVWRNCGQTFRMGPDIQVERVLDEVQEDAGSPGGVTPELIIEALSELMDIECISILKPEKGGGGIKYPDWK